MKTSLRIEPSLEERFVSLATYLRNPMDVISQCFKDKFVVEEIQRVWNESERVKKSYQIMNSYVEITLRKKYETLVSASISNGGSVFVDLTHGPYHSLNVGMYAAATLARQMRKNTKYSYPEKYARNLQSEIEKALVTGMTHDSSRGLYGLAHPPMIPQRLVKSSDHALKSAIIMKGIASIVDFGAGEIKEMFNAVANHSNSGYRELMVEGSLLQAIMDGDGTDRHANTVPYIMVRELLPTARAKKRFMLTRTTIRHIKNNMLGHLERFDKRNWQTDGDGLKLYKFLDPDVEKDVYNNALPILDQVEEILPLRPDQKTVTEPIQKMVERFLTKFSITVEDDSLRPYTMAFL